MITSFEIENFKSFSKKQHLKLSPITLIFGPNSSGKSSIIQSLMMLKQTILAEDKNGVLVTSGDAIDLGTFNSLIHDQDINKSLSFKLSYKSNYNAEEYRLKHSYPMLFGNNNTRDIEVSFKKIDKPVVISSYGFSCKDNESEKINFKVGSPINSPDGLIYKLEDPESLKKFILNKIKLDKGDSWGWKVLNENIIKPFKISSSLNLPTSLSDDNSPVLQYTDRILDDIKELFEKIEYLGPLRSSPKRYYSSEINNYQKGTGKNNLGFDIYNSNELAKEKINNFLSEFNIPYKIDAIDLGNSNTGPLISIQLQDLRNKAIITPKDVGFGIGQVLPIILKAIVSKNKTICVEQPEIHLHPKLQAHLADLFIDSVASKNGNQWIIETHSEALMLRIQRRVRENKVNREDISIIYVDVGDNGAQITQIGLNDNGDFTVEWPDGFFEERLDEVWGGNT